MPNLTSELTNAYVLYGF
jgi:hypothetical protein